MNKLSLGPVLFNWNASEWRDFYFKMADEAPIDIYYIGEIVCSKRTIFFMPYLEQVIERLENAGREVIRSSPILNVNERERKYEKRLVQKNKSMIEVNDISSFSYMKNKKHVIGPYINCYNEASLGYFINNGARRICLPNEIPGSAIKVLAKVANEKGAELEIGVFGRVGLAISARCYHARMYKLSKANCQFVCKNDLDGHNVKTLDGQEFLTINGVQTMSHTYINLINEIAEMKDYGVNIFRINAHNMDMVEVAKTFKGVIDDEITSNKASEYLSKIDDKISYSNGFYHGLAGYEMKVS